MPALILLLLLVSYHVLASEPGSIDHQLGEIVRPITTTVHYADGSSQKNRGNGFVIGNRFYTAYHNIQGYDGRVLHTRIELDGMTVQPNAFDKEHDLAVFLIPPGLCRSWCNDRRLTALYATAREVTWLQPVGEQRTWQSGNVNNLAFKSTTDANKAGECERNLVVEVDVPFYPGSSGGPVFDAATGAIVGIIQGSFERLSGTSTGYYKPVECVLARLALARQTQS